MPDFLVKILLWCFLIKELFEIAIWLLELRLEYLKKKRSRLISEMMEVKPWNKQ